jgi:polyphosphate kinase 2
MLETRHHVESAEIKAVEHEHGVMPSPQDAARLGHENGTTSLTASENAQILTYEELAHLKSPKQLLELLQAKAIDIGKIKHRLKYEQELEKLQIELVKMQRWVQEKNKRVAIIFEGRDAAGKGGTIQRFTEHLNPRAMRVVALPVPTVEEQGQWYFQRYIKQLPNRGEIVFFDRSWYNRAVVEPVHGFCTPEHYERFMRQVPEFEHMLFEDGITLIKFWFSISKEEQAHRFNTRAKNPLKQWKLSPIDEESQKLWDAYTKYKEVMFSKTHTTLSPWIIVKANNKRKARLESIRYVLSMLDYEGKDVPGIALYPDPNVVTRFQRSASNLD